MKDERRKWFVWSRGIGRLYPTVFYDALPSSHDGKRNIVTTPRPLEGEDRDLSLDDLAAKYPPPKGTDK